MDNFKVFSRFKAGARAAFAGSMIFGIISQGIGLFNKYSFHDDALSLFGAGSTYTSGRWMLDVVTRLEDLICREGQSSLPLMNGLISLLCIAAAAALTADLLELENRALCALLGGIMAGFPVVTGTFAFMFTAPYYMLSLLMSAAGAWLICRGRDWRGSLGGILLTGCAIGIYQAYFPVAVSLVMLRLMHELAAREGAAGGSAAAADDGPEMKKTVIRIASGALALGASLAFYLVVSRLYLLAKGARLTAYRGINEMTSTSPAAYLKRAVQAYAELFLGGKGKEYCMYPHSILGLYYLALILCLVLGILMVCRIAKRNRGRAALFALLDLLFPLGVNLIFVLSDAAFVHALMVYGQVMIFALLIWLIENTDFRDERLRKGVHRIALVLCGALVFLYCRYDNRCYMKAEFAQSQAISYFTTLITAIKGTEGYTDELPVNFINAEHIQDKTLQRMGPLDDIVTLPYRSVIGYVNDYGWLEFMRNWCGYYPLVYDDPGMASDPEVENMASYPDDGSIRVIDGILVVKF